MWGLHLRYVNYVVVGLYARGGGSIRRRSKGRVRLDRVRLALLRGMEVRVSLQLSSVVRRRAIRPRVLNDGFSGVVRGLVI